MWARVVEVMLGLWLVLSPFIFGHAYADAALVRSDLASGTLVALAAIVALIGRIAPSRRWLRHAHLLTIAVALWLVVFAYFAGGHPSEPGYKNEILVGLTLLLFAIIPTDAGEPPESWRRHYRRRAARGNGA